MRNETRCKRGVKRGGENSVSVSGFQGGLAAAAGCFYRPFNGVYGADGKRDRGWRRSGLKGKYETLGMGWRSREQRSVDRG